MITRKEQHEMILLLQKIREQQQIAHDAEFYNDLEAVEIAENTAKFMTDIALTTLTNWLWLPEFRLED